MRRNRGLCGTVVQFERPDWRPLTAALGERLAESFMWMHEVRLDDGTIAHAYKHVITRRYLHITADGRAYAYRGDEHYVEIPLGLAVVRLVPDCEQHLLDPDHLVELRSTRSGRR